MADLSTWGAGTDNPFLGQNPYLQNIIDMTSQDLLNNYQRSTLPATNAALVKSGSFGNSGLGEMQRADQETLQRSLGDNASKLRFNDYGQQQQEYNWTKNFGENQRQFDEGTRRFDLGFGRDTFNDAFSQNQQNLQTGIGLIDWLGGRNASDYATGTTQQNAPLNYYQQFSQTANALGGQGGSTTTTQGTTSNPLATALGGAQLGASYFGSNSGGSGGSTWDWGGVDSTGYNSGSGSWWA